jgi:hypothetical protein
VATKVVPVTAWMWLVETLASFMTVPQAAAEALAGPLMGSRM